MMITFLGVISEMVITANISSMFMFFQIMRILRLHDDNLYPKYLRIYIFLDYTVVTGASGNSASSMSSLLTS